MSTLRDFVSKLTHEEMVGIHNSYETFERTGMIGDAPIRTYTTQYLNEIGAPSTDHVVMWMDQLMKEVWRRLALETLAVMAEAAKAPTCECCGKEGQGFSPIHKCSLCKKNVCLDSFCQIPHQRGTCRT